MIPSLLHRGIAVILISLSLSSCGTLGTSETAARVYHNISVNRILDIAEKRVSTNGYQIKDKSYELGKLLSISRAQVGRRIIFMPARYDRTYFGVAASSDGGRTEVLFNCHADESGVLHSSEWLPRKLTEQDQYQFLRLVQEIDSSVAEESSRPPAETGASIAH